MKIIYKNFIKSFELLKNWKYLLLGMLSDFLFLIVAMTSWFFVSNKLIVYYDILQGVSGNIGPESVIDETGLNVLSGQLDVIGGAIKGIYLNLFLFVLLLFVSFIVFKGFSWLIVKYIVNKEKLKLKLDYFLRFSGLTLIWTFSLLLLFFLVVAGMSEDVTVRAGLEIFIVAYLLVIGYFGMISYTYLLKKEKIWDSLKNSFINGIKKIYILVPVFLIVLLVFFIISNLFNIVVNIPFVFFIFTVIFLILCIWARIYLFLIVKEI